MTYPVRLPPPPPPPPPPPKVVKKPAPPPVKEPPAPSRVEVKPDVQAATRTVAKGVEEATATGNKRLMPLAQLREQSKPLDPAEKGQVDRAQRKLHDATEAVRQETDPLARRQATVAATQTLQGVLENKDPRVAAAILKGSKTDLATIGTSVGDLDPEETKTAVKALTVATESAGKNNAAMITDPIATNMRAAYEVEDQNLPEMLNSMKAATLEGGGALFGASLTRSLADVGDTKMANTVGLHHATALKAVRDTFTDATKKADEMDARLASAVENWKGVLEPKEIEAGVQRFKAEHADIYAAREQAATTMESTLDGASLGVDDATRPFAGLVEEGHLREEGEAQLRAIPDIARSEAGSEAIADSVMAEHNGVATYLREANNMAARPESVEDGFREGMTTGVMRSVAVRAERYAREGDLRSAADLTDGVSRVTSDPALKEAYGELSKKIAEVDADDTASDVDKATTLSNTVNQIAADGLSTDTASKFKLFGPALGVGSLIGNGAAFATDPSARHAVDTIVSAAGPAAAAWKLADEASFQKLGGEALAKFGVATTIGFSAVDTFAAIKKGDEIGAAAAAAPAVGAVIGGIAGAGVFSVPGALLGGAIGTVVGIGIEGARSLFGGDEDDAMETQEKAIDPFLRGAFGAAGLPEDAAARMRDVDDDFVGIGPTFAPVAAKLGITPRELLEKVAALPEDQHGWYTKQALEIGTNSDDRKEAAEKLAEEPDTVVPALTFDDEDVGKFAARANQLWNPDPQLTALQESGMFGDDLPPLP